MGSWRAVLDTVSGIDTPFTINKVLPSPVDITGADVVKCVVQSQSTVVGGGLELRLFDSLGNKALIETKALTGTDSFELLTFDLSSATPVTPSLPDLSDVNGFEYRLFIGNASSGNVFYFDNMVAESV